MLHHISLGVPDLARSNAFWPFAASSRTAVQAFHEAALRAGGTDNGAPGLRPFYGPNYYAAFLVDPDGHRIEAVLDAPAD
jgi:catechol 2,3-dioxygenase-like lactoylglutathione lyase family enzyme